MNQKQPWESPAVGTWPLDDEVISLRVFGTNDVHELSTVPRTQIIGTSPRKCDIVLRLPTGAGGPQLARLVRRPSRWTISALNGAPGLLRDRVPLPEFPLVPGIEIGLGGATLVTESERSRALRRRLTWLIGFGAEKLDDVDRALRTVLATASGRGALTLCGDGDLVAVALLLHQQTLHGRPFVVCDPRRRRIEATVRSASNVDDPARALAQASGGTLCVLAKRLPANFDRVYERWRRSTTRVQLVLCGNPTPGRVLAMAANPLVLEPLFKRWRDRSRIIDEAAADASSRLGTTAGLSPGERRLILQHDGETVPDIEKAALRFIALRHWGNLTRAAQELGMARISLQRWGARRGVEL